MSKQRCNPVEAGLYTFIGLMAAFALFCFIMAFSIAMSRPAFASEVNGVRYEVQYKLPKEEVVVTSEVCTVVSKTAAFVKAMFERGLTDKEISAKLTEAAKANLNDRNGWIAYHLVDDPKALSSMREWPKEASYHWMETKFPTGTGQEYYQVYAGSKCDQTVGTTVKVYQVKRIDK